MTFTYQFRKLEVTPKARARQKSRFKSSFSETVDALERELKFLRAQNVVIQADIEQRDIRIDGMLRADARPKSPAVAISFDSKHGPLMYPCDQFDHWQDNIRAIALSLEALRTVDRYGVTKKAEQYQGWAKLPLPEADDYQLSGVEDAQKLILDVIRITRPDAAVQFSEPYLSNAIREAKRNAHPDASTGSAAMFKQVTQAETILRAQQDA
ncbi:MAG: hypothetical protein U0930_05040 [Pirellulales bacterium]